ncbi:MAG TPA: pyrroline-5-carboxylate reductase [Clostridiaceae bacterium]|nr:pyrroline-5-carboxylate reductase [Clostridiaceae bacterium]
MRIGFIGAGNMGEALLAGIIRGGTVNAQNIVVYDADNLKRQAISDKYQVTLANDNQDLLNQVDIVILAIKPNVYPIVLPDISYYLTSEHHLLSLAPGYNFARIRNLLNQDKSEKTACKLSLIMSNTSARIGQAVSAVCFDQDLTSEEKSLLSELFSSVGMFFEVEETQMPTLTSVIGSVPALVYMVIEGIMQGAILEGLPAGQAKQIAAGVVASAANMITQTGEHPAILRDRICSPAGTTIEGVAHLKNIGFEGKIIEAIHLMAEKARLM